MTHLESKLEFTNVVSVRENVRKNMEVYPCTLIEDLEIYDIIITKKPSLF